MRRRRRPGHRLAGLGAALPAGCDELSGLLAEPVGVLARQAAPGRELLELDEAGHDCPWC